LTRRDGQLGFPDLASGLTGSALALIGGAAYSGLGADAVAYGATAAVALPAFLLVLARRRPAQALEPAA